LNTFKKQIQLLINLNSYPKNKYTISSEIDKHKYNVIIGERSILYE